MTRTQTLFGTLRNIRPHPKGLRVSFKKGGWRSTTPLWLDEADAELLAQIRALIGQRSRVSVVADNDRGGAVVVAIEPTSAQTFDALMIPLCKDLSGRLTIVDALSDPGRPTLTLSGTLDAAAPAWITDLLPAVTNPCPGCSRSTDRQFWVFASPTRRLAAFRCQECELAEVALDVEGEALELPLPAAPPCGRCGEPAVWQLGPLSDLCNAHAIEVVAEVRAQGKAPQAKNWHHWDGFIETEDLPGEPGGQRLPEIEGRRNASSDRCAACQVAVPAKHGHLIEASGAWRTRWSSWAVLCSTHQHEVEPPAPAPSAA